jgi:hypothetical protein
MYRIRRVRIATVHVLRNVFITTMIGPDALLGYWDIQAWKVGKRSTAKDRLHEPGHTSALHLGPRVMSFPDRSSIAP